MADAPSPSQAIQPPPTPRVRRQRDQSDEPLGPDEVISVHNVHPLVTHYMIYMVFPEEVLINGVRRDFKEEARRARIWMMIDCTSDAMVDVVAEGYPVYMQADYENKGLPVRGSTPRRMRARLTVNTIPSRTPSGDGGGNASVSHVVIVPFDEGPSSQPSSSSQSSWLGPPDRDAILNWIDSGLFLLVDFHLHMYKAPRLRLAETDVHEARLRSQLAEARDVEKAAKHALQLSSTAVGELTIRVSMLRHRPLLCRNRLPRRMPGFESWS
ncbi:hypothetical protein R1sor_009051 [Riccia sorocarpa]|uniref:Uncharacterized protein n=1 Tax=Riccia sorocarpa TaxID=122646 RepID=A0ABD3H4P0_9MARC